MNSLKNEFGNVDVAYRSLVQQVLLEAGTTKSTNRTGVPTKQLFGASYQVDLVGGERFPLLASKRISWKNICAEFLWFWSGDPSVAFLHRHGCKFWDHWVGPDDRVPSAYGHYWRNFGGRQGDCIEGSEGVDQLSWIIHQLKTNPDSRRLVCSAWDPRNAQNSALPPCHVLWTVRSEISSLGHRNLHLHLTQRSCDLALGLPYNIATYSLLLCLLARLTGHRAGRFHHTIVDAHIYCGEGLQGHEQGLREQIRRSYVASPSLVISPSIQSTDDVDALVREGSTEDVLAAFRLDNYNPHPMIKFEVAV